jgi:hypothetical protein
MTATLPPLCRYCGKPVAKETVTVYFGNLTHKAANWRAEKPTTVEEAKALHPGKLVSLKWNQDKGDRYIWKAHFWDGQTYMNQFFCNTDHARKFGRVMATYGHATKAYCEAMTLQKAKAEKGEAS